MLLRLLQRITYLDSGPLPQIVAALSSSLLNLICYVIYSGSDKKTSTAIADATTTIYYHGCAIYSLSSTSSKEQQIPPKVLPILLFLYLSSTCL
jgi:hypothetical protein